MFDKKRESFETKNVLHFLSVFAFFVSKAKRVPGQVSIQLLKKNMFCQLYSTTNMKVKKITK